MALIIFQETCHGLHKSTVQLVIISHCVHRYSFNRNSFVSQSQIKIFNKYE